MENSKNNQTKHYILWVLVVSVVTVILLRWLGVDLVSSISVVGSLASIFSVIIVFSVKYQITNTVSELNQYLSYSEISAAVKLVEEIQNYLQNDKIELALLRMRDLKNILIQLKCNTNLEDVVNKNNLKMHMVALGTDIENIMSLISSKRNVDLGKVRKNLEAVSEFIAQISGNLKYKKL